MIYLFKTYDLLEFKDFNLFTAIEHIIDDDMGKWETFSDMESLEDFIVENYDDTQDYSEPIDTDSYFVVVDLDNQTISKKIYTLRLELKVIDSDEEIQKLIDAKIKAKEEREKELNKLEKEINVP